MLKSQQNQLSYPFLLFKWLCAAAAIESLLAFFVMLVIPADPKNTWLFGYSKTRILIMGLFLVAVLVAGLWFWGLQKGWKRASVIFYIIQRSFSKSAPVTLLGISAFLVGLLTGWLIFEINSGNDTGLKLRLLPVLIWFFILCVQTLVLAVVQFVHNRQREIPTNENVVRLDIDQIRQVFVYLGVFLILAGVGVHIIAYKIPSVLLERFLTNQEMNDLIVKFSVGIDNNIPSDFTFILLLICASIMFWLAASYQYQKLSWASRWWVSGSFFLILAMDKMTSVHPFLVRPIQKALGLTKIWKSGWYLLFLPLVAILIAWCLPLIRNFSSRFQKKTWLALALILGGGVGIDLIWRAMRISTGSLNLSIELVRVAGEAVKWGGLILLAFTLADLLADGSPRTGFFISRHRQLTETADKPVFQFAVWQPIVALTAIAVLIVLVNLFDDVVIHLIKDKATVKLLTGGFFAILRRLFNMDEEAAFPNTFSIFLLFSVAVVNAFIAALQPSARSRGWTGLSIIFFILSLDEAASLHNSLVYFYRVEGVSSDLQNFLWFVPLIPFLILLALIYIPFWWHLPTFEKVLFVLSGVIYISGAAGMEVVGGMISQSVSNNSLAYAVAVVMEEMMEIGGMILFLFTLFHYILNWKPQFEIQLIKSG
jgi:hypothetical protein